MYMELDNDSDDDDSSGGGGGGDDVIQALTCVKHVNFVTKYPPYDVYKLNHVRKRITS